MKLKCNGVWPSQVTIQWPWAFVDRVLSIKTNALKIHQYKCHCEDLFSCCTESTFHRWLLRKKEKKLRKKNYFFGNTYIVKKLKTTHENSVELFNLQNLQWNVKRDERILQEDGWGSRERKTQETVHLMRKTKSNNVRMEKTKKKSVNIYEENKEKRKSKNSNEVIKNK